MDRPKEGTALWVSKNINIKVNYTQVNRDQYE